MLTAIDTNIISCLWSKEPASSGVANALFECKQEGGLIICGAVYAELLAYPKASKDFIDTFLRTTGIQTEFNLGETVWLNAAEGFAAYAERRRKTKTKEAKRLLVDFIVGAHALKSADRLITLDKNRYETAFPNLELKSL